jgi:hypothetical protein
MLHAQDDTANRGSDFLLLALRDIYAPTLIAFDSESGCKISPGWLMMKFQVRTMRPRG